MNADIQPRRVVIVGGGISGLTAAFHLRELAAAHEYPLEAMLFERDTTLGHALGTIREGGFVMETGADAFVSDKPAALQLAKRLGLESELIGTKEQGRRTFVVRAGKLVEVPEGFMLMAPTRFLPVFRSPLFSVRGKLRMALEPIIPRRREMLDESLGSFVTRRLGGEVLDRVAQPLAGGIYTADPDSLSLEATMPRFLEMERRYGSLFRGLRAATKQRPAQSKDARGPRWGLFVTFRRGMRTLVDELAGRLGACVRMGKGVAALARIRGGEGWELRFEDGHAIEADAVVLATPAFATSRLLAPHLPRAASLLAEITYSSAATVNLACRADDCTQVPQSFGFVVPAAERRKIIAATFSSFKFDGRAPEGTVLMRAFVGGSLQKHMMQLDDGEMIEAARDEFKALLGLTAEPILTHVQRFSAAMPQYKVGHLARIAEIDREVTEVAGLALAGAAYRGVGVPDCIRSGEQAAETVFKELTGRRPKNAN